MSRSLDLAWRARPDTLAERIDPHFRRHPHTRLMARKFRDLCITDPDAADRYQIWTTQPQIGKSTMGSVWGPAWALDWHPEWQILLTSYAVRLARRNARNCRNVFRDHGRHMRTRLGSDTGAAEEWYTTEGGGVLAAGVDGAITGFSGNVVIIDDPHKNRREANSKHMRDLVWDWWTDDVQSRLQGTERVLVVMTRWHPDDLVGRLLAQDAERPETAFGWTVTHLPALADPAVSDPDPLGRQPGEVVCEEMFSRDVMLRRKARTGPVGWAALYQGVPTLAEGDILKRSWWRLLPGPVPSLWFDLVVTSWDMAGGDDGDSWTVGQVWGVHSHTHGGERQYVALDQVAGKWDLPEQRAMVKALAEKWPQATHHLIENASNGRAVIQELSVRGSRHHLPGIVPINPGARGSKVDRAIACTGLLAEGLVHLPNYIPEAKDGQPEAWPDALINQAADFPNGKNDDMVDAMSQALNWLRDPILPGEASYEYDRSGDTYGR